MTPTLLRLLDVQANTLSTGTTAHLQVAIRTLSLPQVFAHTELWRSGNYSGDFKNSKQHQNSNACKDKGSNGTSLVRHLLSQLRMLLTIRLCRSYLVLSAGPRTPPRGPGFVGPVVLQTPGNGVCSPAGGLHVTKETGVISLTPFSGCV